MNPGNLYHEDLAMTGDEFAESPGQEDALLLVDRIKNDSLHDALPEDASKTHPEDDTQTQQDNHRTGINPDDVDMQSEAENSESPQDTKTLPEDKAISSKTLPEDKAKPSTTDKQGRRSQASAPHTYPKTLTKTILTGMSSTITLPRPKVHSFPIPDMPNFSNTGYYASEDESNPAFSATLEETAASPIRRLTG